MVMQVMNQLSSAEESEDVINTVSNCSYSNVIGVIRSRRQTPHRRSSSRPSPYQHYISRFPTHCEELLHCVQLDQQPTGCYLCPDNPYLSSDNPYSCPNDTFQQLDFSPQCNDNPFQHLDITLCPCRELCPPAKRLHQGQPVGNDHKLSLTQQNIKHRRRRVGFQTTKQSSTVPVSPLFLSPHQSVHNEFRNLLSTYLPNLFHHDPDHDHLSLRPAWDNLFSPPASTLLSLGLPLPELIPLSPSPVSNDTSPPSSPGPAQPTDEPNGTSSNVLDLEPPSLEGGSYKLFCCREFSGELVGACGSSLNNDSPVTDTEDTQPLFSRFSKTSAPLSCTSGTCSSGLLGEIGFSGNVQNLEPPVTETVLLSSASAGTCSNSACRRDQESSVDLINITPSSPETAKATRGFASISDKLGRSTFKRLPVFARLTQRTVGEEEDALKRQGPGTEKTLVLCRNTHEGLLSHVSDSDNSRLEFTSVVVSATQGPSFDLCTATHSVPHNSKGCRGVSPRRQESREFASTPIHRDPIAQTEDKEEDMEVDEIPQLLLPGDENNHRATVDFSLTVSNNDHRLSNGSEWCAVEHYANDAGFCSDMDEDDSQADSKPSASSTPLSRHTSATVSLDKRSRDCHHSGSQRNSSELCTVAYSLPSCVSSSRVCMESSLVANDAIVINNNRVINDDNNNSNSSYQSPVRNDSRTQNRVRSGAGLDTSSEHSRHLQLATLTDVGPLSSADVVETLLGFSAGGVQVTATGNSICGAGTPDEAGLSMFDEALVQGNDNCLVGAKTRTGSRMCKCDEVVSDTSACGSTEYPARGIAADCVAGIETVKSDSRLLEADTVEEDVADKPVCDVVEVLERDADAYCLLGTETTREDGVLSKDNATTISKTREEVNSDTTLLVSPPPAILSRPRLVSSSRRRKLKKRSVCFAMTSNSTPVDDVYEMHDDSSTSSSVDFTRAREDRSSSGDVAETNNKTDFSGSLQDSSRSLQDSSNKAADDVRADCDVSRRRQLCRDNSHNVSSANSWKSNGVNKMGEEKRRALKRPFIATIDMDAIIRILQQCDLC